MNKNNLLYLNSNLICNFKPHNFDFYNNLNVKKNTNNLNENNKNNKKNHQIFCKNFFIYLLLFKKKHTLFISSEIFIKKKKSKIYTILKSPYRYKIARHQIAINRYNISFSSKINIDSKIIVKNWKNLINLFSFLLSSQKFFESNLIYVNSLKFNIPINYKNNFLIKNYFKNK